MEVAHTGFLKELEQKKVLDDELRAKLNEILGSFKTKFKAESRAGVA